MLSPSAVYAVAVPGAAAVHSHTTSSTGKCGEYKVLKRVRNERYLTTLLELPAYGPQDSNSKDSLY
jgi:hypothetical protein